ncbi:MAG: hypothetical protein JNL58_15980 [Planctomyces sp.]|nr:hypothetical protein [Planctomyces sp.]
MLNILDDNFKEESGDDLSGDGVLLKSSGRTDGRTPDVSGELNLIRCWALQVSDYGWPQFGEFSHRLAALRGVLAASLTRPRNCHCENCSNAVCEDDGHDDAEPLNRAVSCFLAEYDELTAVTGDAKCENLSWLEAFRRFEKLTSVYQDLRDAVASR